MSRISSVHSVVRSDVYNKVNITPTQYRAKIAKGKHELVQYFNDIDEYDAKVTAFILREFGNLPDAHFMAIFDDLLIAMVEV